MDNNNITKGQLDALLTKMFVACNIPFRAVENEHFTNFIHALQSYDSHYRPPCRKTLGSTFINHVHDEIIDKRKKLLKNTYSVILVDGWKNKHTNRKYLVFSIRNDNTTNTFLYFIDYTLQTEDGESLAKAINDAIAIAKEIYNTHVYAIITDNDSKIVCGGRLAESTDKMKLWQTTCSSHSGNLFVKSLVNSNFSDQVRSVVTVFREPKLQAVLVGQGGTKLQNYPDTRFNFFRDTCQSVKKNFDLIQRISMIEDVNIDYNVFETIFDENFKLTLFETIDRLDPVCKLINACQNPHSNIADAVEMWLSLKLSGQFDEDLINARIKKAIWPVGCAANMLHPKYQGNLLSDEQQTMAFDFFSDNFNHETLQELDRFLNDREESIQKLFDKCNDPFDFWGLVDYFYPLLSKSAIKLFIIPASTAELEGVFSHWSFVHNAHRNRLLSVKSAKIVDIYYSLRHFQKDLFD